MNNSHLNRSVLRRGAGNQVQTNKIQIGKPVNLLMESQLPHHDGEAIELNGTPSSLIQRRNRPQGGTGREPPPPAGRRPHCLLRQEGLRRYPKHGGEEHHF